MLGQPDDPAKLLRAETDRDALLQLGDESIVAGRQLDRCLNLSLLNLVHC